jgi:hypothetical protein
MYVWMYVCVCARARVYKFLSGALIIISHKTA